MVWYDGRKDECTEHTPSQSSNRRKKGEEHATKREEVEQRVEDLAKELKDLHGDKLELTDTQYCLSARMFVTGVHASKDTLPQVPDYRGGY